MEERLGNQVRIGEICRMRRFWYSIACMANPEHQVYESVNNDNVVETLALFLSGRTKREDFSENNQSVLNYHLSLMEDDPKFKNAVVARKNETAQVAGGGKRIPLYTDKELESAKAHRKHRKRRIKTCLQPELFKVESSAVENTGIFNYQSIIDPEKKLVKLHREFEKFPYWHDKNSLVAENIGYLKLKLRNIIGLPIARGKDPHVNDRFYKFLVKRIVHYDVFGIFIEYDGLKHDEPTDLGVRIHQVKNYIGEALNNNAGLREKYMNYNEFVDIYNNEWGK